eukprot:scaffold5502_cov115-Isochrysis_galbana.AAC.2
MPKKISQMTMALPSFSMDSPAMTMVRTGGAPSSLSSATTATGSVAASTEPKASARFQSQSYGSTKRT